MKHIGDQTYGKFPKDILEDQIIMEYASFLPLLADFLPPSSELSTNDNFKNFLKTQGSEIIYEMSDFLMMTLPSPRINYYESSDYFEI